MRLFSALGATLLAVGLLLTVTSTATAQTVPPLVTDFGDYPDTPQALLTDGCDSTGVIGLSFSANGEAAVADLGALPELHAGDTVTFSWTGVAATCVGSAVSLVVKDAPAPFFDPSVDQPVTPGGYNATFLTAGPGSVTLVMPDLTSFGHACAYQMDAVVGVPLAIVGPSGSFYSASSRGDSRRTTLVSFRNSAYQLCVAQVSTTTTTAPTTTMPPTAPPTSPPSSATSTPSTTEPPASASPAGAAQSVQAAQVQRTLAATGTTPWTALVGLAAVGAGVLLLVGTGRRNLATRQRTS